MRIEQLYFGISLTALAACYARADVMTDGDGAILYRKVNSQISNLEEPAFNCTAMEVPEVYHCVEQITGDQFTETIEKLDQSGCFCRIYISGQIRLKHPVRVINHQIIRLASEAGFSSEQTAYTTERYEVVGEAYNIQLFLPEYLVDSRYDDEHKAAGSPVFSSHQDFREEELLNLSGTATLNDIVVDSPNGYAIRHYDGVCSTDELPLNGVYWCSGNWEDLLRQAMPGRKSASSATGEAGGGKGKKTSSTATPKKYHSVDSIQGIDMGGSDPPEKGSGEDDDPALRALEVLNLKQQNWKENKKQTGNGKPETTEENPTKSFDAELARIRGQLRQLKEEREGTPSTAGLEQRMDDFLKGIEELQERRPGQRQAQMHRQVHGRVLPMEEVVKVKVDLSEEEGEVMTTKETSVSSIAGNPTADSTNNLKVAKPLVERTVSGQGNNKREKQDRMYKYQTHHQRSSSAGDMAGKIQGTEL